MGEDEKAGTEQSVHVEGDAEVTQNPAGAEVQPAEPTETDEAEDDASE